MANFRFVSSLVLCILYVTYRISGPLIIGSPFNICFLIGSDRMYESLRLNHLGKAPYLGAYLLLVTCFYVI
jgi:hypothetical protein